jgi:plastocyanin
MSEQGSVASASGLEYLIPLQYDPVRQSLTIVHSQLTIRPGDRVTWVFQGIPAGWSPWIQFKPQGGPRDFLGPFESLNQVAGGIWGAASAETGAAAYVYRACINQGVGLGWQEGSALLCSPQATLTVATDLPATAPVEFTVSSTAAQIVTAVGELAVHPEHASLESGQTVIWKFDDIPQGETAHWRPRVTFGSYEGDGTVPNQLLGPFTCLAYAEGRVTGLGNSGVAGKYHFEVALVAVTSGEVAWLSSGDPVIDNRGSTADPISGG